MKRLIITLIKYAVSFAIIAFLVVLTQRTNPNLFDRFLKQPKKWGELTAAFVLVFTAVLLTFVRWYFMVRALDLPFRMRDAMRLGFLGFFSNFFSLGSVGGDLIKAFFIAREHPERRPEAVASVMVDRLIGLYSLFLVATVAILVTGLQNADIPQIRVLSWTAIGCTVAGAAGILMLLIPGVTSGRLSQSLARLPKIGHIIEKLIAAIRIYASRPDVMLLATGMSLAVHSLLSVGLYFIARGLPGTAPGLPAHFVIVPLSMLTGALPLPIAGLGAFEAAMDFLYTTMPGQIVAVKQGQGLLVSLIYRLITIVIAMVGAVYYLRSRREVSDVMDDVEHAEELGEISAG